MVGLLENQEYGFNSEYQYLDRIDTPSDLKKLKISEMRILAREIRDKIIKTIAQTGGHLGSPLGVVELTIALHYVFDSPKDKIIFDTGHQCYPHKLLTGRRKNFHTLRQENGIGGFCRIEENEHDIFGAGHAGTAISAALGIAKARDIKKENFKVVAVTGDSALTAGISFEGLNNAGFLKSDMLIILNDNNMSISPTTGALSNYLKKASGYYPEYVEFRKKISEIMQKLVPLNNLQKKLKLDEILRPLISPGNLFEELGIRYYGPIDGHDLNTLISMLNFAKSQKGPILLHIKTQKGKGYHFAENDKQENLHGMSPFNISDGQKLKKSAGATYTEFFSDALVKIAQNNPRIVAITAAMKAGTGLREFEKKFPERFFDVGIAEQHAVTFAGGLAREGLMPVCAIYSTFLQRAYDQIIHDICIQNLPVIFALDRAGLVGDDGATHQGVFDIAYLRKIPNMTVMVPKDENEMQHMLYTATFINGPCSIRYPRGTGIGVPIEQEFKKLEIGKAEILSEGSGELAIICVGPIIYDAIKSCKELRINATIVNARFVKPLDKDTINKTIGKCKNLILIEEGILQGGFCSAVLENLKNKNINIRTLGIPDKFIEHAPQSRQKEICGLSKDKIKETIREMVG